MWGDQLENRFVHHLLYVAMCFATGMLHPTDKIELGYKRSKFQVNPQHNQHRHHSYMGLEFQIFYLLPYKLSPMLGLECMHLV